MVPPRGIKKSVQLLVEGKDQVNVFDAFAKHLGCEEGLQLQDFGGVDELRSFLQGFVKSSGFDSVSCIGIVRDAEESATAAFQSVQSSLQHVKLPVPGNPEELTGNMPAVAVLILPGDAEQGMLETLLCRSFADDPVNDCIEDFLACAAAPMGAEPVTRRDKARAHAYIATKSFPQVSVGVAAQKGYWPLNHEVFAGICGFLEQLAREPARQTP